MRQAGRLAPLLCEQPACELVGRVRGIPRVVIQAEQFGVANVGRGGLERGGRFSRAVDVHDLIHFPVEDPNWNPAEALDQTRHDRRTVSWDYGNRTSELRKVAHPSADR